MKRRNIQRYERYEFADSPWTQDLTQRDLANLLGSTKDRLEALIRDKDEWVGRRVEVIAGKRRNLAVPYGKLRTIHERLSFILTRLNNQTTYSVLVKAGRNGITRNSTWVRTNF